jgi:hypothetical protein
LENPKSKTQIPNKFQGLKFQNPGIGSRVATWSLEFIWVLDFGISRPEWKTFDASALGHGASFDTRTGARSSGSARFHLTIIAQSWSFALRFLGNTVGTGAGAE